MTEILSSPVFATYAVRLSGVMRIPTGNAPSARRRTTLHTRRSTATTSLPWALDTRASFPSGRTFTRMGNSPTSRLRVTLLVATSISDSVPAERLVTYTLDPSGEMSIPSAPAPVASCPRTSPVFASTAVTFPLPIFAVNTLPARSATTTI